MEIKALFSHANAPELTIESENCTLYKNIFSNSVIFTALTGKDTDVFLGNGTPTQPFIDSNIRNTRELCPVINRFPNVWIDENDPIDRDRPSETVKLGTRDSISIPGMADSHIG